VIRNQHRPALPRQLLLFATCLLLALATLNPLRLQAQFEDRGPEIAALISADFLAPGRSHLGAPQVVQPGPEGAAPGDSFALPPRAPAHHLLPHSPGIVIASGPRLALGLGPRGPPSATPL
jgi:hypothetical protein